MPILADALQDAGCENADVSDHCRDVNSTHCRGCGAVDLVLGKERKRDNTSRSAVIGYNSGNTRG